MRSLVYVLILLMPISVLGSEWKEYTNEELYKLGQKAVQEKDWVSVLKYLFAYQVRVEQSRTKMSAGDQASLINNIKEAETWVRKKMDDSVSRPDQSSRTKDATSKRNFTGYGFY